MVAADAHAHLTQETSMPTTPKSVLFVVTSHDRKGDKPSGFYLSEATHPHAVLSRAGHRIEFVSPKGGKAPLDPDGLDLKDPINAAFWNDASLRSAVENTKRPSEVDAERYAGIFYVGGHAAMWDLPDDTALASLASNIYQRGGVVGAVCHGPAGLLNVKLEGGKYLVSGKDVSAFTNDEERAVKLDGVIPFFLADRLAERGARHHPAANWQPKVVVSERLVTGQNPASATGVGEAMATLLGA
jgi:putative intracellular protease/amidase